MRALVTGGAGFIGSHLVDALLARGDEVCVLDHLSTGSVENLAHISSPQFRLVKGSILNQQAIGTLAASCDTIYHLAAAVGVRYIVRDPLQSTITNVEGTANVLAAASKYGRKVVLASSSEVYGKNAKAPLRENDDRVLGPTTINRWSYSSAKAIDEHLGFAYAAQGLPVIMLRFFNSYGPRIHANGYGTVVARFISQALRGEPITVHGDGRQTRCFTYVEDTVAGILLGERAVEAQGQVFNIGNPTETNILTLARLIKSLCGSASEIVQVPYEDFYGQSFEDTPRRVPDITRARVTLGFEPKVPLEKGLLQTIAWCREHDFQRVRTPVSTVAAAVAP